MFGRRFANLRMMSRNAHRCRKYLAGAFIILAVLSAVWLYYKGEEQQLSRATKLWERGDKLNALRLYERIAAKNPSTASRIVLHNKYAALYRDFAVRDPLKAAEYRQKAERSLSDWINRSPNDPYRLYIAARIYDEYLQDPTNSLQLYRKSIPLFTEELALLGAGEKKVRGVMMDDQVRRNIVAEHQRALEEAQDRVSVLEGKGESGQLSWPG